MSYILDALRRADAERQQGHVPGIHAAPAAERAAAHPSRWMLGLGLLAVSLLVAAAAAALLVWRVPPAPVVPPTVQPVPQAAAPAPPAYPAPLVLPPALPVVVSAAPLQASDGGRAAGPAAPASAALPVPQPVALRAVLLSSLPPEERRQLPLLTPGGSVWSDSAASRFVILDGQVLREGDAVAPGVVLERIERKAAVLRWKDRRLEVPL